MTEMNSDGKQAPKLDDLLREIKKLSTKMKEGKSDDSTSSKEGTVTSQPTSKYTLLCTTLCSYIKITGLQKR